MAGTSYRGPKPDPSVTVDTNPHSHGWMETECFFSLLKVVDVCVYIFEVYPSLILIGVKLSCR